MPLESFALNTAKDVTQKAIGVVDSMMKKAWSILDAASEKKPPSEILKPKAINAIQGKINE